jgi:fluoroacetyl-CoA thioesterase
VTKRREKQAAAGKGRKGREDEADAQARTDPSARLVFKVRAHDGVDLIGEGRHERFVVTWDKFNAKVAAKAAKVAQAA